MLQFPDGAKALLVVDGQEVSPVSDAGGLRRREVVGTVVHFVARSLVLNLTLKIMKIKLNFLTSKVKT
jgi:hypothetical protein